MSPRTALTTLCLASLLMLPSVASTQAGAEIHDDLFAGVWSPFQFRWTATSTVCISGAEDLDLYRVSIVGSHSATDFQLNNEVGDPVSYSVFWQSNARRPFRGERLRAGQTSRRVHRRRNDCSVEPSARINVLVNRREINAAPAGIYKDTLQVMISPI